MRKFRSFIAPALAVIVMVALAVGLGTAAVSSARAEYIFGDRASPAAGADKFGNIFLFWKGTDSQLEEGWYNNYDDEWTGPIDIGNWTLGTTPTVAVSPLQSAVGPGGHLYSWLYVYWAGASSSHDLYLAYWNGSWHGPVNLGMGPIKYQPTASSNGEIGTAGENVYWGGEDNNIYYAYSTTYDATSASDYSGPHSASYNGHKLGPIGSSPSTTIDSCGENVGPLAA